MPLYFAYGSNMDVAAMKQRCPASRPLGVARLARHRFVIMTEGFASVVRDPTSDVHGVLFNLAQSDVPALDRYEDVQRGLYSKVVQPVVRAGAGAVRALVYVGRGTVHGGTPKPAYLGGVVEAARAWKLPEAYVARLASHGPGEAPASRFRAIKLQSLIAQLE